MRGMEFKTIICGICNTSFSVERNSGNSRRLYCSHGCALLARRACEKRWRDSHKSAIKESMRKGNLRRAIGSTGITEEIYYKKLAVQNGTCGICREPCPTGKMLAIDHDHKTGLFRGLLCSRCNSGLGMFRDNPRLLSIAAVYLAAAHTNIQSKLAGELAT